ncbi:hypothetical protein QN372_20815 [Undibacterium sp. RTI2.1]|uniref:hypothetical protein n=1 Tax=unclassified Undibacterium TaxID=2630295 RepID=UPI002AB3C506|nr:MULTISPECIES: hypothetical protein [unclassified Undibacterium]MDY7540700.1 hypothetical protein [Undibacterium sp. 5I1]MEB0033184.1 hypothetical protein [Undibacterium sp. RTI2.1]MEB0118974.1 hypothetical protein [Undibacterium sp. RTI2.2]MEB0233211.1 hypothetical protein [Undibacterium sp. 10I3]MEB0259870.1 hypothetical protein [Undibacterium sp. 5I1]
MSRHSVTPLILLREIMLIPALGIVYQRARKMSTINTPIAFFERLFPPAYKYDITQQRLARSSI